MSTFRRVDGVWIGSRRGSPEDLSRVEGALSLIKQHRNDSPGPALSSPRATTTQ
jgi:hypothetical protein